MLFHNKPVEEVARMLSSDIASGLNTAQVETCLSIHGENKLREKKKETTLQRFFNQFKDAMILILIAAARVSFVIAFIEGHPKEIFEP